MAKFYSATIRKADHFRGPVLLRDLQALATPQDRRIMNQPDEPDACLIQAASGAKNSDDGQAPVLLFCCWVTQNSLYR